MLDAVCGNVSGGSSSAVGRAGLAGFLAEERVILDDMGSYRGIDSAVQALHGLERVVMKVSNVLNLHSMMDDVQFLRWI